MASAGPGSAPGMFGELFKVMAGVDLVTVNYRGTAPALPDLASGRVHVMFDVITSSIALIRAGRLRALAVTTRDRSEGLPDVPTVREFVPGYEGEGWQGIAAPVNTPSETIVILNRAINDSLADAGVKTRIADLGHSRPSGFPHESGAGPKAADFDMTRRANQRHCALRPDAGNLMTIAATEAMCAH
jgi:tripartite-type tricarboxylate transporter receptor subunit TctC